jgi:NADH-quinone oxidoreductase subunit F
LPALSFLERISKEEPPPLGKRVVVIGGGNAAIDSARTALRMGSEVTVVYRRERKDMPAIPEETEAAEAEGAKFAFLATPHRIVAGDEGGVQAIECVKTRLGEFDASGRRRPVATGEILRFACDTVILAVGETVDLDFLKASGLKLKDKVGMLEVNPFTLETSRNNFYAGGDLISGASNVSNAMGYGKKAARNIDERLMGEKRWARIWPEFDYSMRTPAHVSESRRHHVHELPAKNRVRNFHEAVTGFTPVEAMEECGRCLRCDIREDAD